MSKKKSSSGKNPDIVLASEMLPTRIHIMPLVQRPLFPGITMPLIFSEEQADVVLKAWETESKLLGVVFASDKNEENIFDSELYEIGTVLKLHQMEEMDGMVQVLTEGLLRFKKENVVEENPLVWEVEYFYLKSEKPSEEVRAYTMTIINFVKELLKLNPLTQEQLKMVVSQLSMDKPGLLMDLVASMLSSDSDKLQALLETIPLEKRAKKLLTLIKEEIEVNKLKQKFKKQVEEKISQQQKEFFLKEQLKAIKEELGMEKDEKAAEIEGFEKKIKELELTEEADKVIKNEMEKLKMLPPQSSEYHVTRNYLEWLTELPWGKYSQQELDISHARKILDKHHYGLKDIKERILEYISTIIKTGRLSGSIICLVGPPGVGKTSIGRSIADALHREFYRFSVGGMRDEAEIKGHRRTYIGAMPGKFIQSLKRTGSANPVIMLDEIDKIGMGFQGDPASALLEVLDPEQNKDFLDHYLDVRFDLSKVLFVTTANQLETIPAPLLNRMEILRLSGYVSEEKVQIAQKHLIPKLLKDHGLKKKDLLISKTGLNTIIEKYAREAGVRLLEQELKKVMRKITLRQAEGKKGKITLTEKNIEDYLGKPRFETEELYQKPIPGIALGLAYTSLGGATLYIEATSVKSSRGGFKQTGQLGKVMQESTEIAYTYIRALTDENKEENHFFNNNIIHLHVPAGATPKDGPSAGITMALAIYSLATGKSVRTDIAMTGEITLTGKVLPIGGVKEKTIAAKRVGIPEIIFPKDNRKDFEELEDYIRKGITPHYVDYFAEVIDVIYRDGSEPKKQRKKRSHTKRMATESIPSTVAGKKDKK